MPWIVRAVNVWNTQPVINSSPTGHYLCVAVPTQIDVPSIDSIVGWTVVGRMGMIILQLYCNRGGGVRPAHQGLDCMRARPRGV